MTAINQVYLDFPNEIRSKADAEAELFCRRWHLLCERYLPVKTEDSIWRYSRDSKAEEPLQGWKLHISATVIEVCDLFEKVAPFLISQDVQFKAPKSLDELSKINCGLQYGYYQVGKFITIYPSSERHAVHLASELHKLTSEFISISVPFDEQYLPDSSVFYRYGAFAPLEITDEHGRTIPVVKNLEGQLVLDDRFQAVPEWLADPFQNNKKKTENTFADTPLGTTYRVFRALMQRGKGGTYLAFDLSKDAPQLCIVKEGRRYGEVHWNGQDGYCLVKNEFDVLTILKQDYEAVPQVFSSFEMNGNFYFSMEYVEGKSLHEIMRPRRRRFSIRQILGFAVEIAKIIEKIHHAGWIWNDCKPANLIVTNDKSLRPLDFEGAYRINQVEPFDWKTQGFSKSVSNSRESSGKSNDIYALGAVLYFLLTGIFYDSEKPVTIGKLRRNVPIRLIIITEKLLSGSVLDIFETRNEFEEVLNLT